MIIVFCQINKVYAMQSGTGWTANGYNSEWIELQRFNDQNIFQITSGAQHTLYMYLSANGTVWSSGYNHFGQLGNYDMFERNGYHEPSIMEYFMENDVKIKYIACGGNHSLMIDFDGRVYGFGSNVSGECGVGPSS